MLMIYFRRDIPAAYDVGQLDRPEAAIKDRATFRAGWVVLVILLAGFFLLEPLGVPVSAVAPVGPPLPPVIAPLGHVLSPGQVLEGAPGQVVILSLGMYLDVYGLRNAGPTGQLLLPPDPLNWKRVG